MSERLLAGGEFILVPIGIGAFILICFIGNALDKRFDTDESHVKIIVFIMVCCGLFTMFCSGIQDGPRL